MNKSKNVSESPVLEIISLSCGALNLIHSVFAIYLLVMRIKFLLSNSDYVTIYDYIYIGVAAFYLLINLIGIIMAVLKYFLIPVSTKSIAILKVVFNIIFIAGIAFYGITIIGLVLVVIYLPKSDYVGYIKFLLYQVIIFEGVGLLLFNGTFIPLFISYHTEEERTMQIIPQTTQAYEMVQLTPDKQ